MAASVDDLRRAIGCLTTIFPQFVTKELSKIADEITVNLQGFTDPFAALEAANTESLVESAAELSEGSVFRSLTEALAGVAAEQIKREVSGLVEDYEESPDGTVQTRIRGVRNMSKAVASRGSSLIALYNDSPYVATQRMCEALIELNEIKISTINCIRTHMRQLVNAIMVIAGSAEKMKATAMDMFGKMSARLNEAEALLVKSQPVVNGQTLFNGLAFTEARDKIMAADSAISPLKTGTTFLDVAHMMAFGEAGQEMYNEENQALAMLSIRSLMRLVQDGANSLIFQVRAINYLVESILQTEAQFKEIGKSPRVRDVRASLIKEVKARITELSDRVDAAIARGSVRAASAEMLLWSSRIKSIVATMDRANNLSIEPGSPNGPGEAEILKTAQTDLINKLESIQGQNMASGIEDITPSARKIISIAKAAERALLDIEEGKTSGNRLATLHAVAVVVAGEEAAGLGESQAIANSQIDACTPFTELSISSREQFDSIIGSMRELGMDRGADLLNIGRFKEYMDADTDTLSYLGVAINCLGGAMRTVDDIRTKRELSQIRDDLVARRSNQEISAVDSAVQGQRRTVKKLKDQISRIQKNAETVKSIAGELSALLKEAKGSFEGIGDNLDNLKTDFASVQIGSGGRLAGVIEEFSDHPNAGVLSCKPL